MSAGNPFAGDMARLVGPVRDLGPGPATERRVQLSDAAEAALRRRAESEARAMRQMGLAPDPPSEPHPYMAPGNPTIERVMAPAAGMDLVAIDLRTGAALTTTGRYTLNEDEFALAAKIALDAVNRQITTELMSLADQYGVTKLVDKMARATMPRPPAPPPPGADANPAPTGLPPAPAQRRYPKPKDEEPKA